MQIPLDVGVRPNCLQSLRHKPPTYPLKNLVQRFCLLIDLRENVVLNLHGVTSVFWKLFQNFEVKQVSRYDTIDMGTLTLSSRYNQTHLSTEYVALLDMKCTDFFSLLITTQMTVKSFLECFYMQIG